MRADSSVIAVTGIWLVGARRRDESRRCRHKLLRPAASLVAISCPHLNLASSAPQASPPEVPPKAAL